MHRQPARPSVRGGNNAGPRGADLAPVLVRDDLHCHVVLKGAGRLALSGPVTALPAPAVAGPNVGRPRSPEVGALTFSRRY